jgi:hypothetical protein
VKIAPWADHAPGYNSSCGFVVKEGKAEISLSPDVGWYLSDLRRAVSIALKRALDKDAEISKYLLRVRGCLQQIANAQYQQPMRPSGSDRQHQGVDSNANCTSPHPTCTVAHVSPHLPWNRMAVHADIGL